MRADAVGYGTGCGNLSCPVRLALFTDTLGDVNGVSRFVTSLAGAASRHGESLHVFSSTRFPVPTGDQFRNHPPLVAGRMPGYGHLELTFPPWRAMLSDVHEWSPDAIHVSTPGPVGFVGRWAARRLGVPLLGTYHTDFAAYAERLFDDAVLGEAANGCLRWFYSAFDAVLTRSDQYRSVVARAGIAPERTHTLRPGINLSAFHPAHRNQNVWPSLGLDNPGVVVLSCGRVSVEKDLPMLAHAWRLTDQALRRDSVRATLVVVGDGPYLPQMRAELQGTRTAFLGFRHGPELSAIYASSDLLAFPSRTDTLGQVVMEAQASGVPALVSPVGGPQSLIRDGTTGVVVRSTQNIAARTLAWSEAIQQLVRSENVRHRMGLAAHKHLSAFDFDASSSQFWEIHRSVLARA